MNGILRRKSTLRSSVDQNSEADKNLPPSATEDSTSTSTGSCNASNFDDGLPMNPGSRICSSAAAANSGHCSNLILGGGSGCGGSRGSGVDLSGGLGGVGGGIDGAGIIYGGAVNVGVSGVNGGIGSISGISGGIVNVGGCEATDCIQRYSNAIRPSIVRSRSFTQPLRLDLNYPG